ncbi:hypothetical protein F7725_013711 [Dissostichus mawsoni]|uniref:Uncharacterized protein n=1 Tax=Dissostichus mawsoni TaxID=36200 RepID=A0A7J5YUY6_DISMA|nr:hypothetical protein F7725_013711 [Dissostichus mawsoni]
MKMMMLQPLWDLLRGHSSLLLSPLFPVLFSLGGYLTCCLPYLLLDLLALRWASLRRYKLQPQSSVSWASVRSCLSLTLYNHLVFLLPITLLHGYLSPAHLPAQAPPFPASWPRCSSACCCSTSRASPGTCCTTGCPGSTAPSTRCTIAPVPPGRSPRRRQGRWRPEPGLLLGMHPGPPGPAPPQPAGLLPAQHLALCGGPLRLRPALGHAPPLSPPPVRGRAAPRPAPPQLLLQLRTILHPLGPPHRDPADPLRTGQREEVKRSRDGGQEMEKVGVKRYLNGATDIKLCCKRLKEM